MESEATNASQSRQRNAIKEQYEILNRSASTRNWTHQIPAVIYTTRVTRPHKILRGTACGHDKPVYAITESKNRALAVSRHYIKAAIAISGRRQICINSTFIFKWADY